MSTYYKYRELCLTYFNLILLLLTNSYEDLLAGRIETRMGRWRLEDTPDIFLEDPDQILVVERFLREICGKMEDRHNPEVTKDIDRSYFRPTSGHRLPRPPQGFEVKPVAKGNSRRKVYP